MDSLKPGINQSLVFEDTGLCIASPADAVVRCETEDKVKKSNGVVKAKKAHGGNVVYAYLNEVKNWPILTRDQEYVFAKAYYEAESEKASLLQQWVKTFSGCIDRRLLNHSSKSAAVVQTGVVAGNLIEIMDKVAGLVSSVAAIDARARQATIST